MAKIDPTFPHDLYSFLHRPLRVIDQSQGDSFLERLLLGAQHIFEDTERLILALPDLIDPAKTRADLLGYLKDHVGFTKELDNITQDLSENDLRKLISLAVALWKQKGTEPGYENIVRLFTGKAVRIFNWFDFRLIIGEKAFGEEQLGEDSWLISVPGVEAAGDQLNDVVDLLTFESDAKDRSLSRNHGTVSGAVSFFNTPANGFPQGSRKYARFQGGHVVQPHSVVYDLSGDFTLEMFIRTTTLQAGRALFYKRDGTGRGAELRIDTAANTLSFVLDDSVVAVTGTLTPSQTLADGTLWHVALVVDRAVGARLYVDGSESTPIVPLGTLSDVSTASPLLIAGDAAPGGNFEGDIDNFRLALNAVYPVTNAVLTPPLSGFIEYREEMLDEYFTDVRIVDEGGLNKTLMLRILNLMRPASERLNVIFIRFFDDFSAGSGRFVTLLGTSRINTEVQLELDPNSMVATDVLNDDEFKDIVLQVKANDVSLAGGVFSVLFFVQDVLNFYEYRIDTAAKELSLHKTVGGTSQMIGSAVSVDIAPGASYVFTVQTSFDEAMGMTLIHSFFDSNRIHKVSDAAFTKGKFGMKTAGATTMQIDEVEMMELPVDVRQILPGFNL